LFNISSLEMQRFLKFSILLFLIIQWTACGKSKPNAVVSNTGTGRILATAYGENLYYDNIGSLVSDNTTPEDSAKAINGAVQKWLRDRVMLHTVADKVKTTDEIEALVEDYRNSLLLQRYRAEMKIDNPEPSDTVLSQAELMRAYDSLKTVLSNEQTMLQCDFVAIPAAWKDMPAFLKLWNNATNPTELETFCTQNAEAYSVNKWLSFENLAAKLPKGALQESSLGNGKTFSVKKPDTHYYIRVRNLQAKGQTPSFEAAESRVRTILLQQRKGSLWDKAVESAYQAELKAGHIEIK
jgi:hypothetical protein